MFYNSKISWVFDRSFEIVQEGLQKSYSHILGNFRLSRMAVRRSNRTLNVIHLHLFDGKVDIQINKAEL